MCSPVLTVMVVSNMFWNIGSVAWGGNQTEIAKDKEEEKRQKMMEEIRMMKLV